MTWKPKQSYSAVNVGACPNCGTVISLGDFLDGNMPLVIKGETDPVDVSEPNYHCDNCDTDIVVDLTLQFIINAQVFQKQYLTSEAE